mmetsp:Transcript_21954/g.51358  ORF Transcript_21954/g.51358 Transcript_21954/m.51358 type:complete len:183 (+) Transcript_21954:100-648(+)
MSSRVWVGGAKSTTPQSVLEQTFSKYGKIVKVETGFPGFAFVEFDHSSDAEAAVKDLHEKVLPGIGKLGCQVATLRGYEDACRKRDEFRKGTYQNKFRGSRRDSRSPSRGRRDRRPPPRRRRSSSRHSSRGRGSPRRSPTPQRGGRQRSRSRSRGREPPRKNRSRSRARSSRSRSPPRRGGR